MKRTQITLKQFHSIRCPVCHAGAGKRYRLQSGGLRIAPHGDRVILAEDAYKKKTLEVPLEQRKMPTES